jgi:gliding motility-associated-like protein
MTKKSVYLFTALLYIFPSFLQAQEFFICDDVGNIGKVNLDACSYKSITLNKVVRFFSDITFHPNGKLYGCSNNNLYEIDTLPDTSPRLVARTSSSTSLTADKNGLIYGADNILWSYNLANSQFRNHGLIRVGNEIIQAGGDLTFYNGNLYVSTDKNKMVQLDIENPNLSSYILNFSSRDTIYGIMSYKDCDKVRTFATSNNRNSEIFEIDWLTKATNSICKIPVRVYGAASRYEFLASKSDTTFIDLTTCDSTQAKTTTQLLKNSQNCDSIVANRISYIGSPPTYETFFTCDSSKTPLSILRLKNQKGCDSLVYKTGILIKKDTTLIERKTCDPQKVGLKKDILKNKLGCDSLIFTNFSLTNNISFTQKINLCEGENVRVGDTTYKTTGVYVKTLKNTDGCDSTITTQLTVNILDLTMPKDTLINLGDSIRLTAFSQTQTPIKWKWTPKTYLSCDTCASTLTRPLSATQYRLTVSDTSGKCRKEGAVYLRTQAACPSFVPTAFSPNGDGVNDKLAIFLDLKCVKKVKRYAVFTRWGNLVSESQGLSFENIRELPLWDGLIDGKTAPTEVYVYFVELEYINGETEIIRGDATLLN